MVRLTSTLNNEVFLYTICPSLFTYMATYSDIAYLMLILISIKQHKISIVSALHLHVIKAVLSPGPNNKK